MNIHCIEILLVFISYHFHCASLCGKLQACSTSFLNFIYCVLDIYKGIFSFIIFLYAFNATLLTVSKFTTTEKYQYVFLSSLPHTVYFYFWKVWFLDTVIIKHNSVFVGRVQGLIVAPVTKYVLGWGPSLVCDIYSQWCGIEVIVLTVYHTQTVPVGYVI
jgi:hypothetical protein